MLFDFDIQKTLRSGTHTFELNVQLRSNHQRIVILGPSGAGKSLTLKALAGLLQPDRGHIEVRGRTLFDDAAGINLPPQRRELGYVFQNYALFPHLSVRQNIAFGLTQGWLNPGRRARNEAVEQWLERFHLHPQADLMPHQISGGQQQRTALARSLVARPRALLLDEPFSALDPGLRAHMRQELAELLNQLQMPMLLITHDATDAQALGDQVLRLRGGTLDAGDTAGSANVHT